MIQANLTELYGKGFYDSFERSTFESADVIVPTVMQLLAPRNVVDVGCGRGIWLRVFLDHGVSRIQGLDGDHASADNLFIPRANFTPMDLTKPFSIGDHYDLAVCLEVAEHLPDSVAEGLVRELTRAAPCVLFSAAVPGQGGQHHINEQWPEYWHELFRVNGFVSFDYFRPQLFPDKRVCSWYRQNLVLYVSIDYLSRTPSLAERLGDAQECRVEWIHVDTYRSHLDLTPRRLVRILPTLIFRAIKNRLNAMRAIG